MAKRSEQESVNPNGISAISADPGVASQRLPSWSWRDWLWSLIFLLAVILVYSSVWWAGFIWDDDVYVTANPVIVGPLGLKEIWTTKAAEICPLTITSFWVEHALWGLNPLPYHLVNVVLHGLSAILLWRVLRQLAIPGAWLGAALWALHPVLAESVAWTAELKNTQSTFFYLLSILFFTKWLKGTSTGEKGGGAWNYAFALLFGAMAIASKSSTLILPLVLCLCSWWMKGRWEWRTLVRVAPLLLVSLASGVLSMWTQKFHDAPWSRSWPERFILAGDAVWFYLGKLAWPHPLVMVYPGWQSAGSPVLAGLSLVALVVVLLVFWVKRQTWARPWFAVSIYFIVALLPVLGLLEHGFLRHSFVSDHFQNLAAMGPLALAGAGIVGLADLILPGRWLRLTLGAAALVILGLLTWQRAWVYRSEETLWTDTLLWNPNCWVGYNNLGIVCLRNGQTDQAMAYFQHALAVSPNDPQAHYNLGFAFEQKGQLDDAMAQYRRTLEIYPDYVDAHNNLAIIFQKKGRLDEAIVEFQEASALNPSLIGVDYNLGNAFSQKGQLDEAIAQYEKTLKIDPNFSAARNNLGNALLQKGRVDEGIAEFQMALAIAPNVADTHYNLGLALLKKGQPREAAVEFQRVLQLNPGDSGAQDHLAKAQAAVRLLPGAQSK